MTSTRFPLAALLATIVLVLALFAAFVLGSAQADPAVAAEETSDKAGIVVSGTGKVQAAPDQLEFTVGVRRRADSVGAALAQANRLVARIRTALVAAGVQEGHLQTTGLTIEPRYEYSRGRERLVGYAAGQDLTVRVERIAAAGRVIGAAAQAGGNDVTVHGIRMVLEDRDAVLARARTKAIEDARQNAEQFAEAAGRELGRLVFVEQGQPKRPAQPFDEVNLDGRFVQNAAADVPLSIGEEELSVTVSVRWALD